MKLTVYSMRYPDPRTFEFPPETPQRDAAREAATAFGYEPDRGAFSFCEHERDKYTGALVFDRDKPVSALPVDTVELCDVGGMV